MVAVFARADRAVKGEGFAAKGDCALAVHAPVVVEEEEVVVARSLAAMAPVVAVDADRIRACRLQHRHRCKNHPGASSW